MFCRPMWSYTNASALFSSNMAVTRAVFRGRNKQFCFVLFCVWVNQDVLNIQSTTISLDDSWIMRKWLPWGRFGHKNTCFYMLEVLFSVRFLNSKINVLSFQRLPFWTPLVLDKFVILKYQKSCLQHFLPSWLGCPLEMLHPEVATTPSLPRRKCAEVCSN